MRIRFLVAVVVTSVLAGCSDASTSTAPRTMRPEARFSEGLVCRSGYHVATREDGTQYCEADLEPEAMTTAPPVEP